MKKPSRVIIMALCKTYGSTRSVFMCNAIDCLNDANAISRGEAEQARAAVMKFVRSYKKYAATLRSALEDCGIIEKNITRQERMKVTRKLYIKLAIKLFFKGM